MPPVGDTIVEESWVICLDEFQVTDIADAMILKQLFAYLFDKGIILIATSNRPPKDLYKNGIQRSNFLPFLEMLGEKCEVVDLTPGVDYRRKNLGGSDKLFFNISKDVSGISSFYQASSTFPSPGRRGEHECSVQVHGGSGDRHGVGEDHPDQGEGRSLCQVRPTDRTLQRQDLAQLLCRACGGILDCDFTELCARPLWTNDYLKITQVP